MVEARAGVQVNINNQATPGYVINLREPEPAAKTIDHEASIIPAAAHGTAGDIARDAAAERKEQEQPRP